MKVTILTDNTTRIDAYYLGEPAACFYIECDDKNILFDIGYSDVYVRNAEKMGIDLLKLNAIAFSHGHDDHTRGLTELPAGLEGITIYAHPDTFVPRVYDEVPGGSPYTEEELSTRFNLNLSEEPAFITDNLVFLGQIPRNNDFEGKEPIGKRLIHGKWEPDYISDDSALVYKGRGGLTIITGCSHSGICNITEYAKKVCNDTRIEGIIGGFHLLNMSSRVDRTVEYLKSQNPKFLCPCHCTCFHARAAINNAVPVKEVCVGDVIEVE